MEVLLHPELKTAQAAKATFEEMAGDGAGAALRIVTVVMAAAAAAAVAPVAAAG